MQVPLVHEGNLPLAGFRGYKPREEASFRAAALSLIPMGPQALSVSTYNEGNIDLTIDRSDCSQIVYPIDPAIAIEHHPVRCRA